MEFSEFRDGWSVVLGTFFVCFLTDGFMFQFGLFLVELIDEFKSNRATTALIGSIATGMFYVLGPFSGSLADKFGSRRLVIVGTLISFAGFVSGAFAESIQIMCITYGLVGGMGYSLLWVPANACVMKHFTKSRALASGMAVCGTGFGTFILSLLVSYLISEYGWRMALFIMSGVILNGIPWGLLLVRKKTTANSIQNETIKPQNEDHFEDGKERFRVRQKIKGSIQNEEIKSENEHKLIGCIDMMKNIFESILNSVLCIIKENSRLMKNKSFMFFLISTFFFGLAYTVPYSTLPDHAAQKGLSKSNASWLVSSIGISTTIGRILFGCLGDQFSQYRRIMFEVMLLIQGISTAAIPLMTSFETKLITTCSFGISVGCYFTSLSVVLADEFGQTEIGKSLGLNLFSMGLSTLAAGPLAGGIYDITNSYNMSFYVAGGNLCLAALWLFVPRKIRAFKEQRKNGSSLPNTNPI